MSDDFIMNEKIPPTQFDHQAELIAKKSSKETHENGCIEWIGSYKTYKGIKTYGQKKVVLHNTDGKVVLRRNTTAPRVSLCAYKKDIDILLSRELECSHLCHNKKCVNPFHLTLESRDCNEQRKDCNKYQICICDQPVACVFPTTYLCILCSTEVTDDDWALDCDRCKRWQHITCGHIISAQDYMKLNRIGKTGKYPWICVNCTK